MDDMNLRYLQRLKPDGAKAKVELLAKYDYGQTDIIDDPYFVSSFFLSIYLSMFYWIISNRFWLLFVCFFFIW